MRMELAGRSKANALQERACRTWNPLFSMINWHAKGRFGNGRNAKEVVVLNRLSPVQIQNNTTRGTTPGLVNPSLGVAGGVVPLPRVRPGKGEARLRKNVATQAAASMAQQGTTVTDPPLAAPGDISANFVPASLPSVMFSHATMPAQTTVPGYLIHPVQTTQQPDFDSDKVSKLAQPAKTRQINQTPSLMPSHRIGPVRTGDSLQPNNLDSKRNKFTDTRSDHSLARLGHLSDQIATSPDSGLTGQAYSHAQPRNWNKAYENYPITNPTLSSPSTQYNWRHRPMFGENNSQFGGTTNEIDAHSYAGTAGQETFPYRLTGHIPQHYGRTPRPTRLENTSETVDDVSDMSYSSFHNTPSCQHSPSLHRTSSELPNNFNHGPTYAPSPLNCMYPPQGNGQDVRPHATYHLAEEEDNQYGNLGSTA